MGYFKRILLVSAIMVAGCNSSDDGVVCQTFEGKVIAGQHTVDPDDGTIVDYVTIVKAKSNDIGETFTIDTTLPTELEKTYVFHAWPSEGGEFRHISDAIPIVK